MKKCDWPQCNNQVEGLLCEFHYLCKEAAYGLEDLNPLKDWTGIKEESIRMLKTMAIIRLSELTKYVLKRATL